jgi:hypothetical protein
VEENNMRTFYIVEVTYHTYKNEIDGTEGYKETAGIFFTSEDADDFIEFAPDYDPNIDAELYYKVYPVELNVHPEEE